MLPTEEEIYAEVYGKIKKLIVTKKMMPGELITNERLTYTLDISDNVLSVALNQLLQETLLINEPDSGLMVRELSTDDIVQMFDCRIALEAMTVKLFTQNAPQSKIDDLRSLLVPFEKGPQSIYVFHRIDRLFHEFIAKHCGNNLLYRLFKSAKILPFIDLLGIERSMKSIVQEHLNVISAIHQRDVEGAMKAMIFHLENTKRNHL